MIVGLIIRLDIPHLYYMTFSIHLGAAGRHLEIMLYNKGEIGQLGLSDSDWLDFYCLLEDSHARTKHMNELVSQKMGPFVQFAVERLNCFY